MTELVIVATLKLTDVVISSDESRELNVDAKFKNLTIEKQERIINAAMKEFVESGYNRASTNQIVDIAGISKGSLFNYFNNKRDLYLSLLEHAKTVIYQIYQQIDFKETDFFKRIEQVGWIKLNLQKKYPKVFDFLKSAAQEDAEDVKEDIDCKLKDILEDGLARLYKNIDYTKFREDIDIEKVINIINWTMVGFAEQERDKLASYQDINQEIIKRWEGYSSILKRCFYKN